MPFDDDYAASIAAALIFYGLVCGSLGYWLRTQLAGLLREIFGERAESREPRAEREERHAD